MPHAGLCYSHSNVGYDTHLWPMPQLATACHSLRQCQILNPLSKASDRTCILMASSWVVNPPSYNENFNIISFNDTSLQTISNIIKSFWNSITFASGKVLQYYRFFTFLIIFKKEMQIFIFTAASAAAAATVASYWQEIDSYLVIVKKEHLRC